MGENIRVLIVDDNPNARRTIKHSLLGISCNFSEATSGEEALGLIANNQFDLIFLDFKLPGIDGIETFEKAQQIQPNLGEVIFITGFPDKVPYIKTLALTAFAIFSKNALDRDIIVATVTKIVTIIERTRNPINVFLSYARPEGNNQPSQNDLVKVETIYHRLMDNHFFVWFDKETSKPGVYWKSEIEKAIEKSDYFLACLSSFSCQKVGYIQIEFMLAWQKQNRLHDETYIIPICLDNCSIPSPFDQLTVINYEGDWFSKLQKALISKPRKES
jgi:CheY-like chemotaxis protein